MERPRRLRQSKSIRDMAEETFLKPGHFMAPLFICGGKGIRKENEFLPELVTTSVDRLLKEVDGIAEAGIRSVLLFGVATKRDPLGKEALDPKGPVVQGILAIRKKFPELIVATDIALDPYTDHGHDGLFKNDKILNDETVEVLCKMSLLHAEAGAQMVAPSDMMDGRVRAIRESLDAKDFQETLILSYTAKYASALYGPFREALGLHVKGDKKTYQMNPANRREASKELRLDLDEGADMVMVKPATWYLDVISDFKRESDQPIAAYHVSGECAMIHLGAKAGLFKKEAAILESLLSIRRAGADLIVSYYAKAAAQLLTQR